MGGIEISLQFLKEWQWGGQGILWKGWWILECSLLLDPSHLRLHSECFLSLILFAFSKSTKTVYTKCYRIGRWEFLIPTAFNDLIQTTLKLHKYIYTHNQFWYIQGNVFIYPGKCVYLPLWASFVIEASGSPPAGEMWDLCSSWPQSQTTSSQGPSHQPTTGWWMSSGWGLTFPCCWNVRLFCCPQSSRLTGSTGCAHTRNWSHWRLSPLARPALQTGPQISHLRLRKYRCRNCLLVTPLADLVTTFLIL